MLFGEALASFLLAFPALLSIVNPLGGAIVFDQVTAACGRAERLGLARRVGAYSAIVMLVSLWGGSYILSFFGISLNALRIAGGFVVAARAYQMLEAPDRQEQSKREQVAGATEEDDAASLAFFPLTLPFTTGPGAIAVAIALGTQHPISGIGLLAFFAGMSVAVIVIATIVWLAYAAADRLGAVLGPSGRRVVARLAAFLLLGIGVQILLTGIVPELHAAFVR